MPTKRILLIESEEDFAQTLVAGFSDFDAEVLVLNDGKEGLQYAKSNTPDLVLLRVELPRMSGYSVCKKFKQDKKLKSVPLIIMSSEATDETFEQHRKLKTRADDYIIKPFEIDELTQKAQFLAEIPRLDSEEEIEEIDEIISLDDDAYSFEDIGDLDAADEDLSSEDDSTMVMESPLAEAEMDLEKFDEAFDDLEPPADEHERPTSVGPAPTGLDQSKEIADFDDVLESLEADQDQAEASAEVEADEDLVSMLEDLEMSDDSLAEDEAVSTQDEAIEEDLLAGLEMGEVSELEAAVESSNEAAAPEELPAESEPLLEIPPQETEQAGLEPADSFLSEAADNQSEQQEEAPPADQPPPSAEIQPPPAQAYTVSPDPVMATKLQHAQEENKFLRDKINKLESRIEEMHQTFEMRESEIGSLRSKTTSKDKEFLALRSTINAKDRELLEYKEEINNKDQEILEAQEEIGIREKEIAKQQEAVANRDRDLKEQADRFDELLRAKNELEQMHAGKMAEWEERYTREIAELEHKIQVMNEENSEAIEKFNHELEQAQQRSQQIQTDLEDTIQRHKDEVYGLRARSQNEIEQLESKIKELSNELETTTQNLEQEVSEHQHTKLEAEKVPGLESELEEAKTKLQGLEQDVSELQTSISDHEERIVEAYQKIKNDEKIKDKARKALEIAFTLLADEVSTESDMNEDPSDLGQIDEAHT